MATRYYRLHHCPGCKFTCLTAEEFDLHLAGQHFGRLPTRATTRDLETTRTVPGTFREVSGATAPVLQGPRSRNSQSTPVDTVARRQPRRATGDRLQRHQSAAKV
jgi:hypothetical protein